MDPSAVDDAVELTDALALCETDALGELLLLMLACALLMADGEFDSLIIPDAE